MVVVSMKQEASGSRVAQRSLFGQEGLALPGLGSRIG